MDNEAKQVSDLLSRLTGAPFQVSVPTPDDPVSKKRPRWFVLCPDIFFLDKTAHVSVAWEDPHGDIWLESEILDDTSNLVGSRYEEHVMYEAMDMDLTNLSKPGVRNAFGKKFPAVIGLLDEYEKIAKRYSEKTGTDLRIIYRGKIGLATFQLGAKLESRELDLPKKLELIEKAVSSLKEAYREIAKIKW